MFRRLQIGRAPLNDLNPQSIAGFSHSAPKMQIGVSAVIVGTKARAGVFSLANIKNGLTVC